MVTCNEKVKDETSILEESEDEEFEKSQTTERDNAYLP